MVPLELKDILAPFVKRREVPGTVSTRPYKLLECKLEISPGGALRYRGGRTLVTYFAEEGVFFEDLRMSAIL